MTHKEVNDDSKKPPKLVSRRENKKSSFKLGRTIGEKREKLETANERAAARKKDKKRKATRIVLTLVGFLGLILILIAVAKSFINNDQSVQLSDEEILSPGVKIIDENSVSDGKITSKMSLFIARAERELISLGYQPTKVVIPSGMVREVDFYLDGYEGFIKMNIDRNPAVSAEDTDRMIRYLEESGDDDFSYIDVRIDQKAYWK